MLGGTEGDKPLFLKGVILARQGDGRRSGLMAGACLAAVALPLWWILAGASLMVWGT